MGKHNFKKLKIWQEGMVLVEETYKMIREFPTMEKFNLVSQLIRCAVSIPSNIAEGTSKSSNKHFNKYIEDSLGSSFEWETQLIVAFNQQYISDERFEFLEQKIQQLQKMISRFQDGLK
ncbi:MAG TPA: diversity-generating retroelement protein bAvd family protein [Muricauda sp.]|uniref:Four helix bundle protein n=1 Tax=Flagellimonas aurea TaxID=2915619 RepID=A0ABS3G4B0_9FLAO|nr:four helix bundle protein [Allomuricauda aurea]MAO16165.1 diversity-generating retroelement protein bAvd family protein [Allomuricauda sp.]UBZ14233.1 four helix bundle protein [Allomuricauda aquimarina]MBC73483.1 diversity-generating retroelement protein bAvd family protein [Allomuricauda sp.]MBO0354118.1 four helix bundle protein [Allomuricauda aurea]HBU79794.1 diversity-generating retroelement protein bAvd family protein [Allomuricauda sp.]|tara:strand:+ start:1038 stop:1394 length:357 start_codon:yes stop_codon:yes gene_type:complete